MRRKIFGVALSLALLLGVGAQPAQAVVVGTAAMQHCVGPVTWAGSCYLLRGIKSQMKVQAISNQGCNNWHVESVNISKYQPPGTTGNHAMTDFIEVGWTVDRAGTFCTTSPYRAFIATTTNSVQTQYIMCNLSAGDYVFVIDQPYLDGRFEGYVEDTAGGLVCSYPSLFTFSWYHGSGVISMEEGPSDDPDACQTIEVGAYHHNTWTLDKQANGIWQAANTYRSQPIQKHVAVPPYEDGDGWLNNSCPARPGGWTDDWTSGSGNTGDHVAYIQV